MKPATTPPGAVPKPPRAPAVPKPSDSQKTELYRNLGASLRITEGPDKGKEFPIGKLVTLIGREGRRDNDITLTDTSVSREQAKLLYDEGEKEFTLVNESKTNPTHVDGEQVDTLTLDDGAQIEMGRTAAKLERE
jgi:pSer/pThr/pTyr-binding forkhead associated (FHA) protein